MKTLISTIYRGDADLLAVYKFSPDKVILLPDKVMLSTQKLDEEKEGVKKTIKNGINTIKNTFEKLKVKVEVRQIDVYDIKKIIKEVMQIIDEEHKQGNEVILHISEGRKIQSFACLLAAYKRKEKVSACYYLIEETDQPLSLPLLDFKLPKSKIGILEQIGKGETNVEKIAGNIKMPNNKKMSKALAYKLLKELKQEGFIKKEQNELTESGKIAIL